MAILANPSGIVSRSSGLSDVILEMSESAIVVLDPARHVVWWNQAIAAITGISADEMMGCIFPAAGLTTGELETWEQEFSSVLAGSSSVRREYRWKMRDGSSRLLCSSTAAIRDDKGEIACVVVTLDPAASLSRELMGERITERRDMSRFLHGTISQDLIALSFSVSRLQAAVPAGGDAADVNHALDLIDRCCRDARVFSYMLAPPFPCESDLATAIEAYVDFLRDEAGLSIALHTVPMPESISAEIHALFFAVVQEWAARAIRNYPGANLSIRLDTAKLDTGRREVLLEVECTPGVPLPAADSGCLPHAILDGWAIFRERVRDLGGQFEVSNYPTRAFARIAFEEAGPS